MTIARRIASNGARVEFRDDYLALRGSEEEQKYKIEQLRVAREIVSRNRKGAERHEVDGKTTAPHGEHAGPLPA